MVDAATEANTVHMCAFNYRFFPAIQLAHQLIAAGELGEIVHFRSRFLLASAADARTPETTWRLRRETAGSGVIGDMLAHHVDLARYLVGEPAAVTAASRTGSPSRHAVTVDVEDAVVCAVEFAGGALATMEATRLTPGHVLESAIEIDGTRGTIGFDVASLNQLTVATASGRRVISVTEPDHPFGELWWPRGHGIGWGDSFIHQARHFLGAIAGRWTVAPHGATFADGYRCAQVCDAVVAAAETGERQMIAADAVSER
jgi:predicted dehydrogenase